MIMLAYLGLKKNNNCFSLSSELVQAFTETTGISYREVRISQNVKSFHFLALLVFIPVNLNGNFSECCDAMLLPGQMILSM